MIQIIENTVITKIPLPFLRIVLTAIMASLIAGCATFDSNETLLGVDAPEKDRNLFYAVKAGDLKGVERWLGANVNVKDRLGQSALMWACWNGNLEIINKLLDRPKIDVMKKSGNSKIDINLDYNALFCFIMSNNIIPAKTEGSYDEIITGLDSSGDISSNKTLAKLIRKNENILTLADSFGENAIHKIIRSGHDEYMDTILAFLNENEWRELADKKKDLDKNREAIISLEEKIRSNELYLLEKPNRLGERPIQLAVKLQDVNMVRYLLSKNVIVSDNELFPGGGDGGLLKLSFDEGNGNFQIFIELLKAKYEKTLELRSGKVNDQRTGDGTDIDEKFGEYIRNFERDSRNEDAKKLAVDFRTKYEQYLALVNDSEKHSSDELDDKEYTQTKLRLIALLKNDISGISSKEINEINGITGRYTSIVYEVDDSNRKSILQYAIENGDFRCFKIIFEKIKPELLKPSGNGTGDYFVIAMVNKNKNVMEYLLEKNKKSVKSENNLMSLSSQYTPRNNDTPVLKRNGVQITDPLRIFLIRLDREFDDFSLTNTILDFYGSNLQNPNYCEYFLHDYIDDDMDENIFNYIFISYKRDFDQISMIDGRPLYEYLLDPGENIEQTEKMRKLLAYYIDKTDAIPPRNYRRLRELLSEHEGEIEIQNIQTLLAQKEEALNPLPQAARRPRQRPGPSAGGMYTQSPVSQEER
jgi:ankyrin repeat protein